CCLWSGVGSRTERLHMPGSSTTPGRPGARVDVPVRVAFRLRNGVGAQDINLYEAQWLAYALPYRRFAAALTDCDARLGADMDRSGRTEARSGLRMMPTSPRSPYHSVRRGFPRTAWGVGLPTGAFPRPP